MTFAYRYPRSFIAYREPFIRVEKQNVQLLEQNYLSYSVLEMGRNRFVVNVEGMLWTYAITQNPDLLAMAEEAWAQEGAELTQTNCLDDSELHMHGVTMNELMKIPMLLYAYTGKTEYLQAALKADEKMEQANMLADGVNSSSEALAGNAWQVESDQRETKPGQWLPV